MPEVPRDQRPCLRCMKPGHLSADCPLNKGKKGSAALLDGAAGDQPPRTYEIRCVEAEGGESRQRGKPFVKEFGSENFQVVNGRSIPKPSGVRVESWIAPGSSSFRVTPTRNRFMPLTNDKINTISKSSTSRFQVRPESVVDLPPGTDDGRSGVPRVKPQHTIGTGTPSRNSVDRGRFNALEAAMLELDKREAQASNTPLAGTEAADTHTHTHKIATHQINEHDFPKLVCDGDIVQRLHAKGYAVPTGHMSISHDHDCVQRQAASMSNQQEQGKQDRQQHSKHEHVSQQEQDRQVSKHEHEHRQVEQLQCKEREHEHEHRQGEQLQCKRQQRQRQQQQSAVVIGGVLGAGIHCLPRPACNGVISGPDEGARAAGLESPAVRATGVRAQNLDARILLGSQNLLSERQYSRPRAGDRVRLVAPTCVPTCVRESIMKQDQPISNFGISTNGSATVQATAGQRLQVGAQANADSDQQLRDSAHLSEVLMPLRRVPAVQIGAQLTVAGSQVTADQHGEEQHGEEADVEIGGSGGSEAHGSPCSQTTEAHGSPDSQLSTTISASRETELCPISSGDRSEPEISPALSEIPLPVWPRNLARNGNVNDLSIPDFVEEPVSEDEEFDFAENGPGLADSESESGGGEFEADPEEIAFMASTATRCDPSCLCEMRQFHKKRRQRRKRAQLLKARNGRDEIENNTEVGSLPTNDYANQGVNEFRALCGGVEGMKEMMERQIQHAKLPEDMRSFIDEMVSQGSQALGSIAICERSRDDGQVLVAGEESEWIDVEFEVALDSGSTDNVCHEADAPGYMVLASKGSERGQTFTIGDGTKITNDGEIMLNLETGDDRASSITSTFQIAKVSRPLMSVGKICDNNMNVIFDDEKATVVSKADGSEVCTFVRQHGGLYLTRFKLKRPNPFVRQG